METWKELIVYVHYSPSDPGINNLFCEKSTFAREEMAIDKRLPYEDPGRLFRAIIVKAIDEETLRIEYSGHEYILEPKKTRELDHGGRDYTNFWLSVQLV